MELEIGPGADPDSYVVRVLHSVGAGEPSETFTLDLDGLLERRRDIEANVLSSAVPTRRVLSEPEAAVQEVGRRLFESAFTGEVLTAYRTSHAVASERGSRCASPRPDSPHCRGRRSSTRSPTRISAGRTRSCGTCRPSRRRLRST